LALYQHRRGLSKEQADREYGTYNALDDKFLEFQRLCFENPTLDIFDVPDKVPAHCDPEQAKRELVAFTILFALFERAYLMYREHRTSLRDKQWSGWYEYIASYCGRENFRHAWSVSGVTFDSDFQVFMQSLIAASQRTSPELRGADLQGSG
jgi:hypothetical protein